MHTALVIFFDFTLKIRAIIYNDGPFCIVRNIIMLNHDNQNHF